MTILETVIAGGLLLVLGGSVVTMVGQYQQHYRSSWNQLEDRRRAAGALDTLEATVRAAYRARIVATPGDAASVPTGPCLEVTRAGATPAEDGTCLFRVLPDGRLVAETASGTTSLCPNVTGLVFSGASPAIDVELTVATPGAPGAAFRLHSTVGPRG